MMERGWVYLIILIFFIAILGSFAWTVFPTKHKDYRKGVDLYPKPKKVVEKPWTVIYTAKRFDGRNSYNVVHGEQFRWKISALFWARRTQKYERADRVTLYKEVVEPIGEFIEKLRNDR